VRNWNGNVVVDFREFFVKEGKQLPTKKGPISNSWFNSALQIKRLATLFLYILRGDFGDYILPSH
jgi:Transcriptional Coactivator p15 (PC4)